MRRIEASEVDVTPHRPSRRRVLVPVVAGIVVLAAAGVAAVLATDDQDPSPGPTEPPAPDVTGLSVEQETALTYAEWQWLDSVAACLADAGFEVEGFLLDQRASAPRVAAYLGVEPDISDPDLPTPELRWGARDLSGDEAAEYFELMDASDPDSCQRPRPVVTTQDAAEVANLVDQVRSSEEFLTVVAEYAWAERNPETYLLTAARTADMVAPTTEDPHAQERWAETLGVVERVLADTGSTWMPVATHVTDQYLDAAGPLADGTTVLVRLGERASVAEISGYFFAPTTVECGDIALTWTDGDSGGGEGLPGFGTLASTLCGELDRAGLS